MIDELVDIEGRVEIQNICVVNLTVSSLVRICKEICLKTVGLTEANVATVLAGWLSK